MSVDTCPTCTRSIRRRKRNTSRSSHARLSCLSSRAALIRHEKSVMRRTRDRSFEDLQAPSIPCPTSPRWNTPRHMKIPTEVRPGANSTSTRMYSLYMMGKATILISMPCSSSCLFELRYLRQTLWYPQNFPPDAMCFGASCTYGAFSSGFE